MVKEHQLWKIQSCLPKYGKHTRRMLRINANILGIANNINGEMLLECDQSVLKEMGVTKVGDRVRIFVAVKELRTKAYGNSRNRNRVNLLFQLS